MIKIKDFLKVNQLVNIEVISDEKKVERYASRIENINEIGIFLAAPIKNRVPVFILPGTKIKVCFWNRTAIFILHTYLKENIFDVLQQILVAHPETIERIENREFVRVNYAMEVSLSYVNHEGDMKKTACQSRDLSGGGVLLVITNPILFPKETTVHLEFMLKDILIEATGIVIWNKRESDCNGVKRKLLGVRFTCISEEKRKLIINNIYLRQIELRKKGLL